MNGDVAIISFETGYWLQVWQAETESPFPLMLDPARNAYRAYGLEQSLLRSWGPRNLWHYAKARLHGRKAHSTGGDTTQLGGDFIIDTGGVIRMAYRSHDPTDRPPISALLATFQTLQKAI